VKQVKCHSESIPFIENRLSNSDRSPLQQGDLILERQQSKHQDSWERYGRSAALATPD